MQLHQELASFLNHYLSLATLAALIIVIAWAVDFFVIRLKYGPYKELRSVYKKIAHYALPLGFLVSLSGVLLSLFYSEYLGYLPCALCWFQRILLYPMVVLFGIAWFRNDYTVYRYVLSLSFIGLIVSAYHQSLQMGYSEIIPCAANAVFIDCAKPSFIEFGFVTFPLMSLVLFAVLFLTALTLRMKMKRARRSSKSLMTKATVVLLIDEENRVCLARKKQAIHSDMGEISYSLGLYNGYGGKMEEEDESIEDTALRELFDESSVSGEKDDLKHEGAVLFSLEKEGVRKPFMEVHFYTLSVWEGDPKEGSEMGPPTFFVKTDLPYNQMMPADKVLFEKMFKGEDISGEVTLFGKEAPPDIHFVCE